LKIQSPKAATSKHLYTLFDVSVDDDMLQWPLLRRFTKMRKELFGDQDAFYNQDKPKFRFKREDGPSA